MRKFNIRRQFLRLFRENKGAVSIEFAIIAPFMILMLVASANMNNTVTSSTEIGKVTATVADILSQSPTISKETIDTNFKAAAMLVAPNRLASLEMFVVGVEVFADQSTEVLWSRDNNNLTTLTKPNPGASYTLPPEVLERPGFIVSARARMVHTNVLSGTNIPEAFRKSTYDYQSNFVPRSSIDTSCDNCSN